MDGTKIKVLLCSPKNGSGGIAQWTNHIMRYYAEQHLENVDLTLLPMDRSVHVGEVRSTVKRALVGVQDYKAIIKRIEIEIKHTQYDVCHLVSSASLGLFKDVMVLRKLKDAGIKSVVHFRFGRIPELFKHRNWETRLIEKVIKKADRVVVIDMNSYGTLIKRGFKNVEYLPNPVSPKIQSLVEQNQNLTRVERRILFAGHIVQGKGVIELIDACLEIPNIKLRMIGEGDVAMVEYIKTKAASRDNGAWLEMPGNFPFEDVIKEMMQCSVFVLPTYTEGFPNAIIESMACGCSIVTTPVGAIPEMLDIDGKNDCGICVEPKNSWQLKVAIEKMLDDRAFAEQCGQNACNRVNNMYSMEKVWGQLAAIWTKVASPSSLNM